MSIFGLDLQKILEKQLTRSISVQNSERSIVFKVYHPDPEYGIQFILHINHNVCHILFDLNYCYFCCCYILLGKNIELLRYGAIEFP